MATITGTIDSINLQGHSARGDMKTFLVNCQFGTFTGSADIVALAGVGAAIAAHQKNGKTVTLDSASAYGPGVNAAGALAHAAGTFTVASDNITFDLQTSTGADYDSSLTSDVQLSVSVRES